MDEKNQNLIKNHKKLLKKIEYYKNNLQIIHERFDFFYVLINQLQVSCSQNRLYHPFEKFDDIFKHFSEQLNKIIEQMDSSIFQTLKKFEDDIDKKKKEIDEIFIKNIIKKEKKKEEKPNKKDREKNDNMKNNFKYLIPLEDKEKNIFNETLKENIKQIYNYVNNSIQQNILENKIDYINKYNEIIDIVNNPSEIKSVFDKFSIHIKQFSEASIDLSETINNEFLIPEKTVDAKNEKIIANTNPSNIDNEKKNYDFVILNKEEKENENEILISNLIQEIINRETLIKFKKDIDILKLLDMDIDSKKSAIKKEIFLSKISDLCLNSISIVKNENNFIFLANILNVIFLQEQSKLNVLIQIITISNHIKYQNIYLYEIMVKKNSLFRKKSLWEKLIVSDLINIINNYKEEKLDDKSEEIENIENNKNEKNIVISFLKSLPLSKHVISELKKLNNNQMKNFSKYIKFQTSVLLSKYIIIMNHYLVKDKNIQDILSYYRDKLSLNKELVEHLKNLLLILNLNSKHRKLYIDITNNDKTFIILQTLKFLPTDDCSKFLILNKAFCQKIKQNNFSKFFLQKEFKIDLYIKYFGDFLQIFKIKTEYYYEKVKNSNNLFLENNKEDKKVNKKIELIKNDLKRTVFLQQNPNHNEAIKSILFTIAFTFEDIGYYQGFNIIVSFFFQLLNYDEEKTFYFFYGLLKNTKYSKIFENNFEVLKTLYSVFEKIIELNMPEIIYIIKDIKIDIDYFCSSWFILLFIGNINIIDKDDPPLLLIYFLGKFCISGWCAIFNLGLTILEIGYEKIITLEKEELIKYIMKIVNEEKIFDNSNYKKCRNLFEKYEKIIDEYYVDKLIELTKFEYENKK